MNDNKDNQIIKTDVKPILTSIEKIRFSQASYHFIQGMSKHIQTFIKDVKELVDVRQVKTTYQNHYTQSAKKYVQRFNDLRKEIEKRRNKVIKPLLIIIGGAYLFKKAMQAAQKKFSKQMEVFKTFVGDIYQLGKISSKVILDYTKLWTIRVFGKELDISDFLYQIIKSIPSMLAGMFNFICHGLDWLFNNSDIFQSIIIDVALRAYNASFQTSWYWVLSLIFSKANIRRNERINSIGFARYGPKAHGEISKYISLYETTFRRDNSYTKWHYNIEHKGETHKAYIKTGGDKMNSLLSGMSGQLATSLNEKKTSREYFGIFSDIIIPQTWIAIPPDSVQAGQHEIVEVRAVVGQEYKSTTYGGSGLSGTPSVTGGYYVDVYKDEKVSINSLVTTIGPDDQVLMKTAQLCKKYERLRKEYEPIRQVLWDWERYFDKSMRDYPSDTYQITYIQLHILYEILFALLLFDMKWQERQLQIQGIRYHSRFQYSNVDVLRDTMFLLAEKETQSQIDRYHRLYNIGSLSFHDYLEKVSIHLKMLFSDRKQFDDEIFTKYDMDVLRKLWNFGKIHSLLMDIKKYFNSLVSKSKNDKYLYFSDEVSNAQIFKNEGLYLGLYEGRRRIRDKDGNEMWTMGIDAGFSQNNSSVATLGTKAKLQYLVGEIINSYIKVTKNKKNKRKYRCELIEMMKNILCDLAKIQDQWKEIANGNKPNDNN